MPGPASPLLLYLVKQVELAIRSHLDELFRPSGLTALQYTALTVLERHDNMSSAQLARNSFVTAQSMADMIAALEGRGLIERHRDSADRRRLVVSLTADGRALLDRYRAEVQALEQGMIAGLSEAQVTGLRATLNICHANLSGGTSKAPRLARAVHGRAWLAVSASMETALSPLELARRTRRLHGHRPAVVDGDLRLTYEQLLDRCDRWSAALQALGVRQGDRVATIAPNTHAQLESFYAVPQLGAVLVPLNYRLTPDDFVYMVNHSGATVLCAHSDYLDAVDGVRDQMPGVRHFVAFEGASPAGQPRPGWLDYEAIIAVTAAGVRQAGDQRAGPADDQLHQRHHVPAQGRDDHAPERRPEHHRHPAAPADPRGRGVPVDAADVPRQRLDVHLDGDRGRGNARVPAEG